jgi:hypothetical protein
VKEVTPVPPRLRASVPVVSPKATPREEVARAVGTAEALVVLAKMLLAAMEERPMVALLPPTRAPTPAERVRPLLPVRVVVATLPSFAGEVAVPSVVQ